jgi:hypothetical protein
VLRSLCRNADGLFWAGDTAQTISIGSSFRFDDLKAFLFRIEVPFSLIYPLPKLIWSFQKQQHENNSHSAALRSHTHKHPQSFQLATNYRSHAGIVNCAHSVIDLITKFWPYSIDALAREKGIVDGAKPIFLNGWDTDNVRYVCLSISCKTLFKLRFKEQFLFGSRLVKSQRCLTTTRCNVFSVEAILNSVLSNVCQMVGLQISN